MDFEAMLRELTQIRASLESSFQKLTELMNRHFGAALAIKITPVDCDVDGV